MGLAVPGPRKLQDLWRSKKTWISYYGMHGDDTLKVRRKFLEKFRNYQPCRYHRRSADMSFKSQNGGAAWKLHKSGWILRRSASTA